MVFVDQAQPFQWRKCTTAGQTIDLVGGVVLSLGRVQVLADHQTVNHSLSEAFGLSLL